jgi:hypothetical protein
MKRVQWTDSNQFAALIRGDSKEQPLFSSGAAE